MFFPLPPVIFEMIFWETKILKKLFFYQYSKKFSINDMIYCTLWVIKCNTISGSCTGGLEPVANNQNVDCLPDGCDSATCCQGNRIILNVFGKKINSFGEILIQFPRFFLHHDNKEVRTTPAFVRVYPKIQKQKKIFLKFV